MEFRRKVSILAPLIVVSSIAVAQRQSAANHLPTFGVTSELVAIPVSVTDRNGRTVLGLRPEDFAITENGVPQQILSVSRWDSRSAKASASRRECKAIFSLSITPITTDASLEV